MTTATDQPFILSWPCLRTDSPSPTPPPQPSKPKSSTQQKTFAQAVDNICSIPICQLPKPSIKGDLFSIAIPDHEYDAGLAACKYNLHGRIILPKGSKPVNVDDLRRKLASIWKSLGRWGITSIGTSLSGNSSSLKANSSMNDFVILRAFSVKMNSGNAPKIKEVLWQPPILNWLKCNIDGASNGNPGPSACGGIFRNSDADFVGAFAFILGIANSLFAELQGAMLAIEIASQKGWNQIWLETDSILVTMAFKSSKIVPWQLRNRWENCLIKTNSMLFFVTHVYREGNQCADIMANIGLSLQSHAWWDFLPSQIGSEFNRNRLGLSNYRFC